MSALFDVASGNLVFVRGEGFKHLALLGLWNLEVIQGPAEFSCDLVEFCGRDPQVPMGLLKAKRCRAGLGGHELERAARNVADLERAHELEPWQPFQVLGVPFP